MTKSHILIVDPTKFLGNLLIALGIIQEACSQFDEEKQPYTIILDDSFEPLVSALFKPEALLYYPRSKLKNASFPEKAKMFAALISKIRRLKVDKAVDLEGDSVSRILTRLSGARERIGPEDCARTSWYHQLSEPRQKPSEFYKYRNITACVAKVSKSNPSYGKLNIPESTTRVDSLLQNKTSVGAQKIVILHVGASKIRKRWPIDNWIQLISYLQADGFSPVLIGAGSSDSLTNSTINAALRSPIPDLADRLDLIDLAALLNTAIFYIGNDSGPMHLATALGVPAIVIFGPTNELIWGPLLDSTTVMRGYSCPAQCRNGHECKLGFPCLTNLTAENVREKFLFKIQDTVPVKRKFESSSS
jgi:heptosyltransferase-3